MCAGSFQLDVCIGIYHTIQKTCHRWKNMDVSMFSKKTKKSTRSVAVLVGKQCGTSLRLCFVPDNKANDGCGVLGLRVEVGIVVC